MCESFGSKDSVGLDFISSEEKVVKRNECYFTMTRIVFLRFSDASKIVGFIYGTCVFVSSGIYCGHMYQMD